MGCLFVIDYIGGKVIFLKIFQQNCSFRSCYRYIIIKRGGMLATTVNLHRDVLARITKVAIRTNKSRRDIIVMLLMRLMRDHHAIYRGFTTVKYQQDDGRNKWHCFHIRFRHDEYEYFTDLRKLCKCSVSLCIALAVDRYLDELTIKFKKKIVDKYQRLCNYVLRREIIEGVICLHLYWGYPGKHMKKLARQRKIPTINKNV